MSQLSCKRYEAEHITDQQIDKLVDAYRAVFSHSYFKKFLVYPSTLEVVHTNTYFGSNEPIPLSKLDHIIDFPTHPINGEKAVFCYDKTTMMALFKKKLRQHALLVTLEDEQQNIKGFVFGYKETLATIMQYEEWENPILYSGYHQHEPNHSLENLLYITNQALQENRSQYEDQSWKTASLTPETEIFMYGAIGIDPNVQCIENFYRLSKAFFALACHHYHGLLLIAESKKNATADKINQCFNVLSVDGFFKPSPLGASNLLLASLDGLKPLTQTSLSDYVRRIRHNNPSKNTQRVSA